MKGFLSKPPTGPGYRASARKREALRLQMKAKEPRFMREAGDIEAFFEFV